MSLRSRRPPVNMFEFESSKKFLLVSFCILRHHSQFGITYLHPFALHQILKTCQARSSKHASRIIIMESHNAVDAQDTDQPLYALPDSAIESKIQSPTSRTKWQPLVLKASERLEHYRFDGHRALIEHLSTDHNLDGDTIEFGPKKHTVQLITKDELMGNIQKAGRERDWN